MGSVLRHKDDVIARIQCERMRRAVTKGNILFFVVRTEVGSCEVEDAVGFGSIKWGLDVDVIAMDFGMLDGAERREFNIGNGGVDVGAIDIVAAGGEVCQIGALEEIEGEFEARGKCRVNRASGDAAREERLGKIEWARRAIGRGVRRSFPHGDSGKFRNAGAKFVKEEVREIFRGRTEWKCHGAHRMFLDERGNFAFARRGCVVDEGVVELRTNDFFGD